MNVCNQKVAELNENEKKLNETISHQNKLFTDKDNEINDYKTKIDDLNKVPLDYFCIKFNLIIGNDNSSEF